MKHPRFRHLLYAALFTALVPAGRAAYVRGNLVWQCDFTPAEAAALGLDARRFGADGFGIAYAPEDGRAGDGALRFRTPDTETTSCVTIRPDASFPAVVLVEADVKGIAIGEGVQPWHGPKVMLPYERHTSANPRHGKKAWPQLRPETGSFDWKTWSGVIEFVDIAQGPELVLGLERAAGELRVDAVRIYQAREVPDEEVVAPFNEEAAAIPRGPFAEGGHDPEALRGAMSGGDLSEESLRNLAGWGANLLRLQIGGNELRKADDLPAFYAALDAKLDWCREVMDRCHRHGIQVILDLHSGPGCVTTKHAANIIPDDYDPQPLIATWERIAARFRDHPATYAYDILNEPSVEPRTWVRVCRAVMEAVRRIDPATPFIVESEKHWFEGENVIYSPHFYEPLALTHAGVSGTTLRWSYPGYVNGVYWDKDQLRVALRPWIEFQREHPGARILVGEFSCILWVRGADRWIADAIDLFEEYGWSWCYHAYREWPAWDVEYDHVPDWTFGKWIKAEQDTPRKRELLRGLSFNLRDPLRTRPDDHATKQETIP